MRELGQELRLFVVLEVDVVLGKVELEPAKRGDGANLCSASQNLRTVHKIALTYTLAGRLLGGGVESANGCHFARRGGEDGGRWAS